MPQTRPNGIIVPVNSDEYNLTPDLERMADTTRTTRLVNSQAERDALDVYYGMEVVRLDRDNWVQTYTGVGTSGWEYKGTPRRVYAGVGAFTNTSGTSDRLLLTCTGFAKPYAQTYNARLRLSISSASISSGILTVNVAVSGGVASVASAQGKAAMSWLPPGAYLQTNTAETGWLDVAADTDPLIRAWVEVTSGTVTHAVSVDSKFSQFYVDIRPKDD